MTEGSPPAAPGVRLITPAFAALLAAALAFFTAGGVVLPVATRYAAGPLGADPAGVGFSIGVFAIAALLMRPVVGWASDRYGRRPLLLLGGALTVVALALHLVATNLVLFILVRSLLGIAEAFFFVAAVAAISDIAPPERRGEAINIGSVSVYLGLGIGPFIGESVLAAAGFAAVWIVAGALAAVATGLTLAVPETAPAVVAGGDGPRPRARLLHPAGIFPGILILTGAWGMAGYLAFVPLYATEVGMSGAGLALLAYALINVALRLVFAKLPDRVGAARLSGSALAVSAIGLVIMGAVATPLGLMVGTVVFASGIAFMFPALVALAVSRVDETERGSVVGTTTLFLDLAFGLSPAVLGALAGLTGYGATFVVGGAIAAAGSLLLYARRRSVTAPVAPPTLAS